MAAIQVTIEKKDRKSFDEMFSNARLYNSACMMAARPWVFHSVMISIVFQHYKQLMELIGNKSEVGPHGIHPKTQQVPDTTLDYYCSTKH